MSRDFGLIFKNFSVRPCKRQNFPNFLISQVSEMFGYQNSEILQKKPEFLNSQKFFKKSSEIKVQKLKFGNNFEYFLVLI